MRSTAAILAVLLLVGTYATDFEDARNALITSHINLNCVASIGYFATYYYHLYTVELFDDAIPTFKSWGWEFLFHALSDYWYDIYEDLQDYPPVVSKLQEEVSVRGLPGALGYFVEYTFNTLYQRLTNIIPTLENRWANMYPGEFKYYHDLFKKSCPFTWLYVKIETNN